jgi:ferredoxin-NADP reductase/Na+-translocating ferredoxin:NAD+ oxidoreductase RnfD subunit
MIRKIDELLNAITMYRLVLYGLLGLVGVAICLSVFSILPFTPFELIVSVIVLLGVSYGSNKLFSRIFTVTTNIESALITGLILFFILTPSTKPNDMFILVVAAILSMLSKYILAIHKKHLFNPVAISLVILGVLGSGSSIWWVATASLFPFTLILGLSIVRKIRRHYMFIAFLFTSIITILVFTLINHLSLIDTLSQLFISWPIIFFGTVMLTEPLTTPPTRKLQLLYGSLVGILFGSQFHIGPLYSTPELSLVIGNIFSYWVSPKQKMQLHLWETKKIADHIYEFVFSSDEKPFFKPGQYLEWTLSHKKSDSRGNRRYFTIASSPTEDHIKLGVKVDPTHSSSFKNSLVSMKKGDDLYASQLSGDFTLPVEVSKKLVFIAGGIGITPFRSMVKYLLDKDERRDIVLFYAASSEEEFAYKDIFSQAQKLGVKVVYIITKEENIPKNWKGKSGHINTQILQEEVPDYQHRIFYLSGPNAMVSNYKDLLKKMNVENKNIVTDYFPGF